MSGTSTVCTQKEKKGKGVDETKNTYRIEQRRMAELDIPLLLGFDVLALLFIVLLLLLNNIIQKRYTLVHNSFTEISKGVGVVDAESNRVVLRNNSIGTNNTTLDLTSLLPSSGRALNKHNGPKLPSYGSSSVVLHPLAIQNLRISTATMNSTVTAATHRSNVTDKDSINQRKVKERFTGNCEFLNELIRDSVTIFSVESETEVVEQVLVKVMPFLEKKLTKGFPKKQSKMFDIFTVDEVQNVPLKYFLQILMYQLNDWFYEDIKSLEVGTRCLFLSFLYIDRLYNRRDFVLSWYNVYLMFGTLMLVSAKFTEDEIITNEFWAEVLGVDREQLDKMEQNLCFSLGFDFAFKPEELTEIFRLFGEKEYNHFSKMLHTSLPI